MKVSTHGEKKKKRNKESLHLPNEESGRLHSDWKSIDLQPRIYYRRCHGYRRPVFVQVLKENGMRVIMPICLDR
jgi:hypothetical protein